MNRIRIVCAPDSFKESMSALEAGNAMAAGVRRVLPQADCLVVPMADGGEGTVQALVDALGGRLIEAPCHDALGRATTAGYAWVEDQGLAVIEMAAASGLAQIDPAQRDVRRATSLGVGELIRHALDLGARRFIVGLGGSATNDAGAGMAQVLGLRLLDDQGDDLPPGGAALARLARVDLSRLDPRLSQCHFDIACDVDNPLLGPRGASAVFGPQKGADPAMVAELDAALTVWADRMEAELGRTVRDIPGAGAAGGLGAAFAALTASTMRRGIDIVVETVGLADTVVGADWVFTGEGSVDSQTLHGKVPWGVARTAAQAGAPTVIFGGRVAPGSEALLSDTTVALVPILKSAQDLPQALLEGPQNLADAAETTLRLLLAGARWGGPSST